jgi:hypothetical protein
MYYTNFILRTYYKPKWTNIFTDLNLTNLLSFVTLPDLAVIERNTYFCIWIVIYFDYLSAFYWKGSKTSCGTKFSFGIDLLRRACGFVWLMFVYAVYNGWTSRHSDEEFTFIHVSISEKEAVIFHFDSCISVSASVFIWSTEDGRSLFMQLTFKGLLSPSRPLYPLEAPSVRHVRSLPCQESCRMSW